MEQAKRCFVFTFEYTSKFGETVKLETRYDVVFRRYDDSRFTHIEVYPDFGPKKYLKVHDCGITWKSLLRASEYCSAHSKGHIDAWFEMNTEQDVKNGTLLCSVPIVIPEQKLSTGTQND